MKGKVLAINTGSTSTKVGYYVDGNTVLVRNLELSAQEVIRFDSVLEQGDLRRGIVMDFLREAGVGLGDIDIVMARGGLFAPAVTGVYGVNADMREVLLSGRDGVHACNLSAVIADDIASEVTAFRRERGIGGPACMAYVADPPMADEMLPECHVGGLPDFPRRAFFHALNSRAVVRRYLREHGHTANDITAIVAHMGGGITVTLHRNGKVIDTNNGLGGAVAFFGTNDLRELERRADDDPKVDTWLDAFGLNVAKYIASLATTVDGKVDVILLTGGIAKDSRIVSDIRRRTAFIAPTEVYPGENELDSLAENGYLILTGETKVHRYDKERLLDD